MRRHWLFVAGGAGAAAAAIAAALFVPWLEVRREVSPDGAFTAVTRGQVLFALVPMMPGQGSDKPVYVTVCKGSASCGSVRVGAGRARLDRAR